MNILLIEDNDQKATKVDNLLRNAIKFIEITRAKSFRSGIKELESQQFDLLILDMVLPVRDGDVPVNDGGIKILTEIQDGSFCRRPGHIICLTAFESIAESFKSEASRRLVHILLYSDINANWCEPLRQKAVQIERRIAEANVYPEKNLCDLAIITSSPIVELQEVIKLPGFEGEFHHQDSLHYYRSRWKTSGGKDIEVVACAAPTMGMTAAAITASKVISRWRPKYLAMTGIAAGTKKGDQSFGDILVAESCYDYGSGKISETSDGELKFTPSFSQIKISSTLSALIQRWEREQINTDIIKRNWHDVQKNSPRIIFGLLASGAAVVQSKELVADILDKSRKVVGLDMEAYGVMHAANLATSPSPKVLVVKSVSDFADSDKDDYWQRYAAYTSARFIYEFFTCEAELKIGS